MDRFLRTLIILGFLLLCLNVFQTKAQTTVQLTANPITANGVTFTLSGSAKVTDWKGGAFAFPTEATGTTSQATVTISQRIKITSLYFSWGTNVQGASVQLYDGETLKETIPWPGNGTTVPVSNVVADKLIFKETGPSQNGEGDLQKITFSKDVESGPTITATALSGSSFTTCEGTWSPSSTFAVSGSDLTGNINITAPTGYQVSTNSASGFSGSLNLTPASGSVANTTVYVRLDGTSASPGAVSGNISITSTGATTKTLAVSGTVNKLPVITTQPQDQVISVGEMAVFAVEGANVTTYEWEISTNGGAWSKKGTGKSFSFVGSSSNKYGVRCKLINSCGYTYSNEVRYSYEITPDNQNRLFVNKNVSSGLKNGSSWANAIPELADALKWARQNKDTDKWSSENPLQIWVASGTYYPLYNAADGAFTTNGNQDNAFVVVKDVHLYGGFAGTETDTEARNLTNISNKTILSGDIDLNDGSDGTINGNNARHIIISGGGYGDRAVVDGFTITGGDAKENKEIMVNGTPVSHRKGGGLYFQEFTPLVRNVMITNNYAEERGGGLYCADVSPDAVFKDIIVTKNRTSGNGGGVATNDSQIFLSQADIRENHANNAGGGIFSEGAGARLANVKIVNNTSSNSGGGLGTERGSAKLTNVIITGNTAQNSGGGVANSAGNAILTNTTIIDNHAVQGSEVYNDNSSPEIRNSMIFGNSGTLIFSQGSSNPVYKYSLIQGLTGIDNGNIDASGITATEIFVSPTTGDYTLKQGSIAVNAGSDTFYQQGQEPDLSAITTDLSGNLRKQRGAIDLGAYESSFYGDPKPGANNILYVKKDGAGFNDGSSWDNALPELADALKWTRQNKDAGKWSSANPLQIWVAGGTYYPLYSADDNLFDSDGGRDNAFVMVKDVQLYGGFAGTETNLSDRNLNQIANKTILSGDIDQNNTVDENNVNHVVIASGDIGDAVLNGFTISGGNASVSGNISVNGNSITKTSGGGIFTFSSLLNIQGVHLTGNNTTGEGGALYIEGNVSPVLTNVIITGNNALIGGGICNKSSTSFFLTNVTIGANNASAGGAIYLTEAGTSLKIRNSIIKGNKQGNNPVTIGNHTDQATIDFHYSLVDSYANYSGYASEENVGNIDATDKAIEDIFVYPLVAGLNTGGDYTLKAGSAAINKGSNTFYQAGQTPDLSSVNKDLAGNTRVFDGTIDIGAYERQMKQQLITLANVVNDTLAVTYGDANVVATGTGAITYTSSNSGIIEAGVDGLKIKAAGEANISVTAAGNATYDPVTRTLPVKVAKKNLAITNTSRNKTYGEILTSTDFTGTITGTANNDNITVSRNSNGSVATANAATYQIIATVVDPGNKLANYEVSNTNGELTVDKAALSIKAEDVAKIYGDDNPVFSVSYSGLQNNDTGADLTGTLTFDGSVITAVNVGTYTIEPKGLSSGNYEITYHNGTFSITKALLNITANSVEKDYDGQVYSTNPTVTYEGFKINDTESILAGNLSFTGSYGAAKNAGTYIINPRGLSSSNYDITFTPGNLTINKVGLEITANDLEKTYDGLTYTGGNGVRYSGFVNAETAADLQGTLTYTGSSQNAKNVGAYLIRPRGLNSGNYQISYYDGSLNIRKASLQVTAKNDEKVYDGVAYTSGKGVDYAGFVNNETASALSGTLAYDGSSQGAVSAGDNYTITPKGLSAANYELVYTSGTLKITKAPLTVTANNFTKTYDGLAYAGGNGVVYQGLVNNEPSSVLTGTITYSGNSQQAISAGEYDIAISGLYSNNYTIDYEGAKLTINPKALTITNANLSKNYGETLTATNFTGSITGLVTDDKITISRNSDGAQATAGVNTYSIIATLTDPDNRLGNYTITNTNGTLTVNQKELIITAKDQTKIYGDALTFGGTGFTATGLVNADEVNTVTLNSVGATATATTSVYPIAVSDAQGSGLANYNISYIEGNLTVNPKTITVTATANGKIYGAAEPQLAYTYTPELVNGDSFSGDLQRTAGENVNIYQIHQANLALSNNYILDYVGANFSITPKALTVTAENKTKIYGEVNPELTMTYDGLVNGETALSPLPVITTVATEQSGAGTYDINVSGTSANYNITFNKGTLTVGQKALTVIVDNKTKVYGDANPELTVSYDGLVNGETALTPMLTVTTLANEQSAIGNYDIVASGMSVNYEITFEPGTLTIGKKALTITNTNRSKTYGETLAGTDFAGTIIGVVNNDDITVSRNSAGAPALAGVDTYSIVATLNDPDNKLTNYEVSNTNGTLTVSKKALIVTADNKTKIYGEANPVFTVSYDGLVNEEIVLTPAPMITTLANEQSIVGSYEIIANGTSANYAITFNKGTLTINKKQLTVTSLNRSKVYGEALTSSDFTGTISELANNDNITVNRNSTGAPATAGVNIYPIIASLDDPDNKLTNYEVANIQGVLTINKKALIVRADNKAKIYGEVNPVLSVSYQGLENGETSLPLVPAISTTATQQSATGEYPITVVATSDNYELTVVPGILTVGKKPITVTADNKQKVYGETDPQFTYTYTPSLINGDVFSGNLFRTDGENVTEYAIGLGSLTLGDNYSINYNPAKLTVTKAMLYVKAENTERCYGADNPNFNISYEGFKFSDNPTSLTAQPKVITNAVQTSDVGTYILLINGGKSSNYDFIYEEGLLKVNPLPKVSITSNRGNSISKGEKVTLAANGGSVYYWSNADGILGTQSNPVLEVRPMKTTTYTVTATNESGCQTTESFTIEVKEDYIAVKAENFITPNGDGVNDNWVVTNVDAYPEHTLTIVDRSGKVLYKTRNYRNEWDGTANGLPLSAGTYYYIFDFEGKNAIKGFITIVK